MNNLLFTCLLLLMLFYVCSSVYSETLRENGNPMKPVWKEHPYLFIERSDVPEILEKARKHDWARQILNRVKTTAEEWVDKKLEYPPSTGRHDAVYICPECRVSLNTLSSTRHKCPKCRKVVSGLPYDAVLYKKDHEVLRSGAQNLALASLLFNEPKYARKSLDILLGYADRYSSYPLYDINGKQSKSAGHVFDQTLNEAVWIIDMAWAYDLILAMKVGTPEEHRKVEEDFLKPVAENIRKYNAGKSNWQAWHNAGLMAVALVLKDESLVDYVLYNDPGGFFYQMKESVTVDGAWFEGSWSYHYYTVTALLRMAEAAYHSGIDLYSVPQMKMVFEAPLKALMPNNLLPAVHDADMSHINPSLYELAAVRYKEPAFESVLAGRSRPWLDSLLFGIEEPGKTPALQESIIMPGLGAAILRKGNQYLYVDYGPHGGGHGHLDKLAVLYYTADQVFAPDLGRGWPYSLPIHREWYTRTLSHNTVVVDGQDQKPCEGKLERSVLTGDYHLVTVSSDQCYDGVNLKRTTVLGEDWMLDVFEVESDAEHTYDWHWYTRGEYSTDLTSTASELTGAAPGYKYLSNISKADGSQDWKATWKYESSFIHALFRGSNNRLAYFCQAPDKPETNTLHGIILRDRVKTTRYVALFSLKPMSWSDLPEELRKIADQ